VAEFDRQMKAIRTPSPNWPLPGETIKIEN